MMTDRLQARRARPRIGLAVHGGAGAIAGREYALELEHLRCVTERGVAMLERGDPALDVVVELTAALEDSGLFIAGRGSSPNAYGGYELDACVMDGSTGRAGAVAALSDFANPVLVARRVMTETPHVLLAGDGAAHFAQSQGFAVVTDPADWFTRACSDEANRLSASHGTVGCVARDAAGRLASATSTGGVFDKLPGRCGDTPLVGGGCWADQSVAVSCTGLGEYFIRTAAAVQIAHRVRWADQNAETAAAKTLEGIVAIGGAGGVIAMTSEGVGIALCRSTGMKTAMLRPDGSIASWVS